MKDRQAMRRTLSGMLAGMLAFAASASVSATELDLVAAKSFAEQRAAIERELKGGERYAGIAPEDRARVVALLAGMSTLIGGAGSISALDPPDQVAVFNQQEEINRILTAAAADSQVVCRRERRTGSNFPVNRCATVAERRAEREGGRDMMERLRPPVAPADVP